MRAITIGTKYAMGGLHPERAKRVEWVWLLLGLLALVSKGFGAVTAPTTPRQVTVFPDSARITREGSLRLSAGTQHVLFPDLPASIVESSLRLAVEGPEGTKFYGVGLKKKFTPEVAEARTRRLKERLQVLEDQKADLADRMEARKTEIEILKGLAKESADTAHKNPGTIPDFTHAAGSVGVRIGKLLAASRRDERVIRGLDLKIAALNSQLAEGSSSAREKRTAEADLELPQAGTTRFTLTYQVSGASWAPLYDLHLATEGVKPSLDLAFNAGVRQNTGEDWKDVALVLSTSRPTEGTQVPDPTDWWLDTFVRPVARFQERAMGYMAKAKNSVSANLGVVAGSMQSAEDKDEDVDLANTPAPAEPEEAKTVRSEFAMSFSIPTRQDIPSDGSEQRVGITQNTYPVKLNLVAVPRLSEAAYLETKITYEGEQELLAGTAQLFRDGDFVGTTDLEAKAPGESFDLGFGQDDQIHVERKAMKDEEGTGQGIFDVNKGEHRYRWVTTIANYHIGTREVEIREQLPRSRQQNIEVTAGELKPKPALDNPDKPGLVTWKLVLGPKEKTKVDFAYRVKYPAGTQVIGLE